MPGVWGLEERIADVPAGNSSNSLYLSLLAGNPDIFDIIEPLDIGQPVCVRRCNFLNQNVSGIGSRHSPHVWRRARERLGCSRWVFAGAVRAAGILGGVYDMNSKGPPTGGKGEVKRSLRGGTIRAGGVVST